MFLQKDSDFSMLNIVVVKFIAAVTKYMKKWFMFFNYCTRKLHVLACIAKMP